MTLTASKSADFCEQALRLEHEFLAAVEAKLGPARGHLLPGTWFDAQPRDASEAVHRAMVDRRMFKPQRRHELPQGRGLVLRGYKRRLLFGKRPASVTIASVLAPPGPLLDGRPAARVSLAQLADHVRELVAGQPNSVPRLVAVCSPGGFDPEVWSARLDLPGVHVVLVEPQSGGGWKTASISPELDPRLVGLFDPEDHAGKIARVRREIEERGADLLVGGLSASVLAAELSVPPSAVEEAFRSAGRNDPELQLTREAGEVLLFRGVARSAPQESRSMSVTDWIRSLFSRSGDEAQKINVLRERQVRLSQRRDALWGEIAKLEIREQALVDQGKQNTSPVVRQRVAAQVAQLRKEIARQHTKAGMLNQQVNIIATDVHNLELLQQGQIARLPAAEELTEHAVAAEELLESLGADAKLIEGLEAGLAQAVMSDDERAVMREFEAADAARARPQVDRPAPASPGAEASPRVEPPASQRERPQAD